MNKMYVGASLLVALAIGTYFTYSNSTKIIGIKNNDSSRIQEEVIGSDSKTDNGIDHNHAHHDHNHMKKEQNKAKDHPPSEAREPENLTSIYDIYKTLPLGKELSDFHEAATNVGPDAEQAYNEMLEKLKQNPKLATESLYKAYNNIPTDAYSDRWLIIDTMAQISDASSFEPLVEVTITPIPAETSADTHHFSTVKEETLIRVAAFQGLSHLAKNGTEGASEHLLQTAKTAKEPSIVRAAVNGILNSNASDEIITELKNSLSSEYQGFVTRTVTDVSTVQNEEFETQHREIAQAVDTMEKEVEATGEIINEVSDEVPVN